MICFAASLLLLLIPCFVRTDDNQGNSDGDRYWYNTSGSAADKIPQKENHAEYWRNKASATLQDKLGRKEFRGVAKNVIMFLGDGMSVTTLAAARIYLGQLERRDGESAELSFERFPATGLSRTYCLDQQVADSACSASAYLTGVKGNFGTIGVTGAVKRQDCSMMRDRHHHVNSILQWAQDAGKTTGVVTTTRVTHASPAGTYAHTAERDWESDRDVINSRHSAVECPDIAHQMVHDEPGSKIKVILGGGRSKFLHRSTPDPAGAGKKGEREDEDLVKVWLEQKRRAGASSQFVWERQQLLNVNHDKTDFLLGLFQSDHMEYHLDANNLTQPTLKEMTVAAIKLLSREKRGYFLFVEGGSIDLAHHENQAYRALDETVQLSEAVQAATAMTREDDTLIVVTSDHAHTMTFSGYTARGTDIITATANSDIDNQSYAILSYANGPGHKWNATEDNLSRENMRDVNYRYPAMTSLLSETHGGDDVAVFARGPWAHLFTGSYEQNLIPHMMAYAARIGRNTHAMLSSAAVPLANISFMSILCTVFLLLCTNINRNIHP